MIKLVMIMVILLFNTLNNKVKKNIQDVTLP